SGASLQVLELLAHGAASGHSPLPAQGPRLVQPAGLGAIALASSVGPGTSNRPGAAWAPPLAWAPPPPSAFATGATGATRLAAPPPSANLMTSLTAAPPAAFEHVAWTDRWLARLSGASAGALDQLDPASRFGATTRRAGLAPATVLLDPIALAAQAPDSAAASASRLTASPGRAPLRLDDAAETSDDLLMAIATARGRGGLERTADADPAARAGASQAQRQTAPSPSLADRIAATLPAAPGPGVSPELAASPMRPALAGMMPLPLVPSFDVRALSGEALAEAHLHSPMAMGMDGPTTRSSSASPFVVDPAGHVRGRVPAAIGSGSVGPGTGPQAATIRAGMAPTMELLLAAMLGDDPATAPSHQPMTLRSNLLAPSGPALAVSAWASGAAPDLGVAAPWVGLDGGSAPAPDTATGSTEAMVGPSGTLSQPGEPPAMATGIPAGPLGWPLVAPAAEIGGPGWTGRPGMTAERSRRLAASTELGAAGLAHEFVSPEMVLAARVYGLSPADAVAATRLAAGGSVALQSMAGAIEFTFVRALAGETEDRSAEVGGRPRMIGAAAQPHHGGDLTSTPARARGAVLWPPAAVAGLGLQATPPDGAGGLTVAALELQAARVVAELAMFAVPSLDQARGLDRTAGSSVFEALHAGRAPGSVTVRDRGAEAVLAAGGPEETVEPGSERAVALEQAGTLPPSVVIESAAAAAGPRRARFEAVFAALAQSDLGRGLSTSAQAARALALAARDDDGPGMSPRERAALAWSVLPVVHALGHTADGAPATGRETDRVAGAPDLVTGGRSTDGTGRGQPRVQTPGLDLVGPDEEMGSSDLRPGLAGLSHRAGEALSSYVSTPAAAPVAPAAAPMTGSSPSPAPRAPTAAPELIRTGRAGRHGGGEVEIPAWFEQAARRMMEQRGDAGEGISMAELTLVQAAPPAQVAASTRGPSSTSSATPSMSSTPARAGKADIERIAQDVYRQLLEMMEIARWRNSGEP
ncbi:MAG: hypothetical protein KA190_27115, partial [Kofleriaceae bacterium]|nr:hypothetical protein [Kofleriaceae bacterium]